MKMMNMKWIKKGLIFEPPKNLTWMISHAAVPTADNVVDDLFRIYFSGRDNQNRAHTGFFDIDIKYPKHILYVSEKPILRPGKLGTFDDSGSMASWIVTRSNKKYLYYIGWNLGITVPFCNSIGLAISPSDSGTFTRYSEGPLLGRDQNDPFFVANPCLIIENEKWRMWYLSCLGWDLEAGRPKHRYVIKYAESTDGIYWERNGLTCIGFKSKDEYAISRPCVLKENGVYKMWYSYRGKSYRIGYAESVDGLNWERKDHEVGIDVSKSGWDSEMIEYPFVFNHNGKKYMLYNGNGYGKTGIGLAILAKD